MKKKNTVWLKITLLLTGMMTMMAGAVVSPSLPQMQKVFSDVNHADVLTRLIITLPALFIAITAPFSGKIIDSYGRKRYLMFSLILYALSGTSGYWISDLYLILAGRAVLGIAVAGIMTTAVTLVGDYFTGSERNAFMGLQGAFIGLGGVVFISLAGWFADVHWQMPFTIYLFSLPVMVMGILFLYEPKQKGEREKEMPKISEVPFDKLQIYSVYFLIFTGVVFFYMMPVQIPFLLDSFEDMSNTRIGLAISIATTTSAAVSVNYKRIAAFFKFKQIYQLAMLLMGAGYLMVGFSDSYALAVAGLAVSGTGNGLLMPLGNLWVMHIAPASIRGRLVGRASTAMFTGMFLSPLIVQPFVNMTNIFSTFTIAALTMWFIGAVLFFLRIGDKKESS